MSICVLSHFDTYDLRKGAFQQGWDDFMLKTRHKKMTVITKCVKCEIKVLCGMCPAQGELENNDAEKPVDFLCHVAHLRAHVLGAAIPAHGDCEYCEGGSGYEEFLRSASALKNRDFKALRDANSKEAARSLPVVGSSGGCASGGCSSCSAF
jgi:radical SAM protein with 4Fe4S-binding SPASM domain